MVRRLCALAVFTMVSAGCLGGRAGDAMIRDQGPGLGTRYTVELPEVDLGASREHTFTVTRLPRETLLFSLQAAEENLAAIQGLNPGVGARIEDADGAVLFAIDGALHGGPWVLSEGVRLRYQGGWVTPTGRAPYRVRVRVSGSDGSQAPRVRPVLEGGGLGTL